QDLDDAASGFSSGQFVGGEFLVDGLGQHPVGSDEAGAAGGQFFAVIEDVDRGPQIHGQVAIVDDPQGGIRGAGCIRIGVGGDEIVAEIALRAGSAPQDQDDGQQRKQQISKS